MTSAKCQSDFFLKSGRIMSSGSVKNWATEIAAGSVLGGKISRNLLNTNKLEEDLWEIKII